MGIGFLPRYRHGRSPGASPGLNPWALEKQAAEGKGEEETNHSMRMSSAREGGELHFKSPGVQPWEDRPAVRAGEPRQ